jgi:hypothetical protein
LLFACANKIPLRRDWALALLTLQIALLTSSLDMYPDFRIAINCYLNYAAKLEQIFLRFIKTPAQLEDTTGAT